MRSTFRTLIGLISLLMVALFLLQPVTPSSDTMANGRAPGEGLPLADPGFQARDGVFVSEPVRPTLSPAVRDLPQPDSELMLDREVNPRINFNPNFDPYFRSKGGLDPLLSRQANAPVSMAPPSLLLNFDGITTGTSPHDPTGDVGSTYYLQGTNSGGGSDIRIINKITGATVDTFTLDSLGTGLCAAGLGDPIILYDQLAGRWFLSEFSSSGNQLCIYISQTGDPTGAYHAYGFTAVNSFPDYPKYAVWPDAYFAGTNESTSTVYAFDRAQMVSGAAATFQSFNVVDMAGFGFQMIPPADLDGATPPPLGAPATFMRHRDDEVHNVGSNNPTQDYLDLFEFHIDWVSPTNSTFIQIPSIPVAEFDSDLCGLSSFNCFPQLGSGTTLDPLREVIMWRLQYRNFGSYETMVATHVTDVDGNDRGGVRWYELRKVGAGSWSLYQQGTFSPDAINRFMSSGAMDGSGNIAIAYSVSDSTIYPSIRYTGRETGDPLGTLSNAEITVHNGTGTSGSNRWGDYSALTVDPVDDCTFWYTMEYGSGNTRRTRIASFKYASCTGAIGTDFTLTATPTTQNVCLPATPSYTVALTGTNGLTGAVDLVAVGNPGTPVFAPNPVTLDGSSLLSLSGLTVGNYTFDIVGTHAVTSSLVHTDTVSLNVFAGVPGVATLNTPAANATDVGLTPTFNWTAVSGATSYDIEVATDPGFTNMVIAANTATNNYSPVTPLAANTTYHWRVRANNGCGTGSNSAVFQFTTAAGSLNCNAGPINFESGVPADWTVTDDSAGGDGIIWTVTTDAACNLTNLTNGSGVAACADSDAAGSGAPAYDTSLVSNAFDLTGYSPVTLTMNAYYSDLGAGNDIFTVDYWNGAIWSTLVAWDEDHLPEDIAVLLPATAQQLRVRYAGNGWDWYAQVDNVALTCVSQDPHFALAVSPTTQNVCQPNDAIYTVDVTTFNGFADAVTLVANGEPAGGTVNFSPNPVNPTPGISTLTVGNLGAATPGLYSMDVVGMGSSGTHTQTVGLNLSNSSPVTPVLTSPVDMATGVSDVPAFGWTAVPGAGSYEFEVATDPGFTNIVFSTTVSSNNYTGAVFNNNTTYYWRVAASNGCGSSSDSTPFRFTTQAGSLLCNVPAVDFNNGLPLDWTIINNAGANPVNWSNIAACGESGNYTSGTEDAACASSDLQGGGSGLYNTEMRSNPFSLAPNSSVTLNYRVNYQNFANVDFLNVDISTDSGSNWINLLSWNEDHGSFRSPPGQQPAIDLSAYAGQTVMLRWHYYDPSGGATSQDWYVQVDDVVLSCLSNDAPVIDLSANSLLNGQTTNMQVTQTLTISNTGVNPLVWTITEEVRSLTSLPNFQSTMPEPGAMTDSMVQLQQETGAVVSLNQATGVADFIRFGKDPLNLSADSLSANSLSADSLSAKGQTFFNTYGAVMGIRNSAEMTFVAQSADTVTGGRHLVYQQVYQGVPVFGGDVRVHFDKEGRITAVNGVFIPDIQLNVMPALTPATANDIALKRVGNQKREELANTAVPLQAHSTTLYLFRDGLLQGVDGAVYLVYEVEVRNDVNVREFVYVDAHKGTIVEQFTGMDDALFRRLYETNTSNEIWTEGDPFPGSLDQWQQNELVAAGHVYNFFNNAFGYVSYNNADAEMKTINNNPAIACPNANWNGVTANYCTGTAADDVVAHEWGHAYTEYTSGLIYAWQTGAMNESFSDIWGETIDLLNNYEDADDDNSLRTACNSSDRWRMGEDASAFGGAIRDMWNPTCDGDPGKVTDTQYTCDAAFTDNGGVHSNSGVPNHAYALLVDGGTYNGQTITPLGFTKAAHIFFRAQSLYLTNTSDFSVLGSALQSSCSDLIGVNLEGLSTGGPAGPSGAILTVADCQEVAEVVQAVQFTTAPSCGFTPMFDPAAPALCTASEIRQDWLLQDFESGLGSWTVGQVPVNASTWDARDWTVSSLLPDGRSGSAVYGPDPVVGDCSTDLDNGVIFLQSPVITVPVAATTPVRLAFDHYAAMEDGWDGGNLKISVNGGSFVLVPGSAFTFNGYNSVLNTAGVGNDNPLAGQAAFTGANGGSVAGSWGQSQLNLNALGVNPGDTVQLRWELGTDGCNGWDGWYVADVVGYSCAVACTSPADVAWLDVAPQAGTTTAGTGDPVLITFDSTGLPDGNYQASLCINSNDPVTPLSVLPVEMAVCSPPTAVTGLAASNDAGLVALSWDDAGADQYEVWWAINDPFFTPAGNCATEPNCALETKNSHSHAGAMGNGNDNYTFVVLAVDMCGSITLSSPLSSRQAEFDFGILPGN